VDYRKELDRLYEIEYGDVPELAFRLAATGIGAYVHYNYTESSLALFWYSGFALTHAVYFTVLRRRPDVCTIYDAIKCGMLFLVMLLAFIWFPASLVASDDIALRISGTAGTGALLIFLIYRADTLKWMVWGEILVVAGAVSAVILARIPDVSVFGAKVVMAFSGIALIAYFAKTILDHRRRRIEAEAASIRSVQAQKMEAVGQLAGGVAHDFNNILTAITGNLELYEEVEDKNERDQFVREAHLAAVRAAGLVSLLLASSRTSTLTVSDYVVGDIFDQVRILARRLLPSSIQMNLHPAPEGMRIKVDQNQLITAMINLIVNARDAMNGTGLLEIHAEACEVQEPIPMLSGAMLRPGHYVCLIIEDDGPGIPKDILTRVTEPFFTTKGIGEGSGLGLSMVEGFTQQSGGGMKIVTSSSGTRVQLYIPCPECAGLASNAVDQDVERLLRSVTMLHQ
jgi:signal transduction histidine kinase